MREGKNPYLRNSTLRFGNDALGLAASIALKMRGEGRILAMSRLYGNNDVAGEVCDARDYREESATRLQGGMF